MQLRDAFQIGPREVVSFIGGGGKTTVLFRLASELAETGRVVITTTTRVSAPQVESAPVVIRATSERLMLDAVRAAFTQNPLLLVVGDRTEDGKVVGIDPAWVDALAGLEGLEAVLVEADGARQLPFKAPAEHEPVIPRSTTLLVPMMGIDALGQPLDDVHVHRAERLAALGGVAIGSMVDPGLAARILSHPDGGLKAHPEKGRVIPLLNKVENVAQLLAARDIAGQLLRTPSVDAVALGAARNPALPVSELHRRVAAVILAAGGSTRMQGQIKQLLPWGETTLVRNAVMTAARSQAVEVYVIVGNQAEAVANALEGTGAHIVQNPAWAEGRATSIRAAITALGDRYAAALFINSDQPFLTDTVLDSIILRYFQTLAPAVVPVYDRQTGSPVLFDRALFSELAQLHGESGGKEIWQAHHMDIEKVNIIHTRAAADLDTLEQYAIARVEGVPGSQIAKVVHKESEVGE